MRKLANEPGGFKVVIRKQVAYSLASAGRQSIVNLINICDPLSDIAKIVFLYFKRVLRHQDNNEISSLGSLKFGFCSRRRVDEVGQAFIPCNDRASLRSFADVVGLLINLG